MGKKKGVIWCARKGYDARYCEVKKRTLDSTKNTLKEVGRYTIILNEPR